MPVRLAPKVDVDGVLGDAVRVAQSLHSMTATPIEWTLVGFLDIPWKRNLSKQIDVSVAGLDD